MGDLPAAKSGDAGHAFATSLVSVWCSYMKQFRRRSLPVLLLAVSALVVSVLVTGGPASATGATPVGLGSATNFAILAGAGLSNTGAGTSVTGDAGLSPAAGTAYTGLTCANFVPPSQVFSVDATTVGAPCGVANAGTQVTTPRADELTAFTHTSNLPGATPLAADLTTAGSLVAGLYSYPAAATNLSGTLTLDAQGDPNATWIFQASSTLITSPGSSVTFSNLPPGVTAAQLACNVYWTVPSSATLDTTTNFVGTILASEDISVNTGVTVTGRLLAGSNAGGSGAVTLDTDTIVRPTGCAVLPPGTGGGPPAAPPAAPPIEAPPGFTG